MLEEVIPNVTSRTDVGWAELILARRFEGRIGSNRRDKDIGCNRHLFLQQIVSFHTIDFHRCPTHAATATVHHVSYSPTLSLRPCRRAALSPRRMLRQSDAGDIAHAVEVDNPKKRPLQLTCALCTDTAITERGRFATVRPFVQGSAN